MISLTAVEDAIRSALGDPELELVAVNIPDEKKGEKVVLLIANEIKLKELKGSLLEAGVNPMMLPAKVINVEEVPKLGSGKTDFSLAKKVVLSGIA
jgi:acyl-[acyl-carrier-protein]-phospholipid O-acyltransferase/long-chain-fatty-acid--[acyl-carrier-protein] ligase